VTGLPDNDRHLYPQDKFAMEARGRSGRELAIADGAGTGLGNAELSGLWAARRAEGGWSLALVARAELPTATDPFDGAGAGVGLQALAAHPLGRTLDVFAGAGGTVFTSEQQADLDYSRWRAHGFVTLEWRLGGAVSLLLETSAASRLVENIADYPGLQMYFRMGAKVDAGPRWRIEGGFVEGVASIQTTTDFGIQAGVSRRF
jgi:hypothetical protein